METELFPGELFTVESLTDSRSLEGEVFRLDHIEQRSGRDFIFATKVSARWYDEYSIGERVDIDSKYYNFYEYSTTTEVEINIILE